MTPRRTLTAVELEIMQIIWDLREATVRQVYEVLRNRRTVAYTTVMTMMNILEEKGHLSKQKSGRAFVYHTVRTQSQVTSSLISEFLGRVFDGSARTLLLSLVKDRKLTSEDLDEISRLIKEGEEEE
jgi:predicted transcriptional regulator